VGAFEREDRPLGDAEGREAEWHCFEISVTDAAKGKKLVLFYDNFILYCEGFYNYHKK
jgi:hypothetical protein